MKKGEIKWPGFDGKISGHHSRKREALFRKANASGKVSGYGKNIGSLCGIQGAATGDRMALIGSPLSNMTITSEITRSQL